MATTDYHPERAGRPISMRAEPRSDLNPPRTSTAVWVILAVVAVGAIALAVSLFTASEIEDSSTAPAMVERGVGGPQAVPSAASNNAAMGRGAGAGAGQTVAPTEDTAPRGSSMAVGGE